MRRRLYRTRLLVRVVIKRVLRSKGLIREHPADKYLAELAFQSAWAGEFEDHRAGVFEYWRTHRFLDEILALAPTEGKRVLDVGCGISTVLHFITGARYGVDPLAHQYRKLYAYPKEIHLVSGSGEQLPFRDGQFDVVFCSNALDHMTAPPKAVREMHRVLRQGGHVIVTGEIFGQPVVRDPAHPHSFRREDVYRLLDQDFLICFERESPWIGLRNFTMHRSGRPGARELVLAARKV